MGPAADDPKHRVTVRLQRWQHSRVAALPSLCIHSFVFPSQKNVVKSLINCIRGSSIFRFLLFKFYLSISCQRQLASACFTVRPLPLLKIRSMLPFIRRVSFASIYITNQLHLLFSTCIELRPVAAMPLRIEPD